MIQVKVNTLFQSRVADNIGIIDLTIALSHWQASGTVRAIVGNAERLHCRRARTIGDPVSSRLSVIDKLPGRVDSYQSRSTREWQQ